MSTSKYSRSGPSGPEGFRKIFSILNSLLLDESSPGGGSPGGRRIVIDPITRIEGHLGIEVEVDQGVVKKAWSSGTLFRGVEMILQGRRPEDAWIFTQRLCGVCTYVHGSTSVRCVENGLGLEVPENARLIRNLMMGAQFLHDHIIHFYVLHGTDWIDVAAALGADPDTTNDLAQSISPAADPIDFRAVKSQIEALVASGQLGHFSNAYTGHPEYMLSAEENLLLCAHYLATLRRQADTARMHAVFGGKNPHPQSLRVGGVTCRHDLTSQRFNLFREILQSTSHFIDTVYLPDVRLVAERYKHWATMGATSNLLAYGEFPQTAQEPQSLFLPQGVIMNQGGVAPLQESQIFEHVRHSWYQGTTPRHPSQGETVPSYTGHNPEDRYSWLKAPRYAGEPMEVGPLARMMVAYKSGHSAVVDRVGEFLSAVGLQPGDLVSTLGRTACRAIETKLIADAMPDWLNTLESNVNSGDRSLYQRWSPISQGMGKAFNEAPRGALGHWIQIQNGTIGNYQMVVPSTWNFGPRCAADKPGPMEEALVGTPVADVSRPLEILRTVHAFDPCIACAVHLIDTRTNEETTVKIV